MLGESPHIRLVCVALKQFVGDGLALWCSELFDWLAGVRTVVGWCLLGSQVALFGVGMD